MCVHCVHCTSHTVSCARTLILHLFIHFPWFLLLSPRCCYSCNSSQTAQLIRCKTQIFIAHLILIENELEKYCADGMVYGNIYLLLPILNLIFINNLNMHMTVAPPPCLSLFLQHFYITRIDMKREREKKKLSQLHTHALLTEFKFEIQIIKSKLKY